MIDPGWISARECLPADARTVMIRVNNDWASYGCGFYCHYSGRWYRVWGGKYWECGCQPVAWRELGSTTYQASDTDGVSRCD